MARGSPVVFWRTDRHWVRTTRDIAGVLTNPGHTTKQGRLYYPVIAPIARRPAGPNLDAEGLDRRSLQRRNSAAIAHGGLALRLELCQDSRIPAIEARARRALEGFDTVITPLLAHPPPWAAHRSRESWLVNARTDMRLAPYSAQWNVLRWPAASVPAGRHPEALTPMAVQIAAPPGNEELSLSIAAQIQSARPWLRVTPGPRPDGRGTPRPDGHGT